jgi:hypothetical protein
MKTCVQHPAETAPLPSPAQGPHRNRTDVGQQLIR